MAITFRADTRGGGANAAVVCRRAASGTKQDAAVFRVVIVLTATSAR
jgi:hypothetical protein